MKYLKNSIYVVLPILSTIMVSCGGSSSSGTSTTGVSSSVSVATIPDSSSMITTNSSGRSETIRSGSFFQNTKTVTGTAPILSSISGTSIDTYFWAGLLNTITTNGAATNAQKNIFWGKTIGQAGGMGACQMAQGVGESFSNLISAGNTLCYMKGISSGPTGIAVTGSSAAAVFDQAAADKVIKITISGGGGGGGGDDMPKNVYFKVFGTTSIGTGSYKADLWMCNASGVINNVETINVDKTTGAFTDVSTNNQSGNPGSATLTAFLKTGSDGALTYDPSKDRTFAGKFTGTYNGQTNVYKGNLTINSSNQIISKVYRSNTGSWGTNTDKISTAASFSGTDFSTLRFLAAGFSGLSTNYNGTTRTNTYSGGIEFQTTNYVSVSGSTLAATAATVDVSTDTFYSTDLSAPSLSTTHTCSETATITVSMDFSGAGVRSIKDTCDGHRYSGYSMCYDTTVQNAMPYTWGP